MKKIEIINDDSSGTAIGLISFVMITILSIFIFFDLVSLMLDPFVIILFPITIACVKYDLKQFKHKRILSKMKNVPSLNDFYIINASLINENHTKSLIRLTIKGESLTQDVNITHDFKFFEDYFNHVNEDTLIQAPIPGRLVDDTFYIIESEMIAIIRRRLQIIKYLN